MSLLEHEKKENIKEKLVEEKGENPKEVKGNPKQVDDQYPARLCDFVLETYRARLSSKREKRKDFGQRGKAFD